MDAFEVPPTVSVEEPAIINTIILKETYTEKWSKFLQK